MSLTVPAEGRGRGWEKDVRKRVGGGGRDMGRRGGVLHVSPVRVVSDVIDSACRGEGKRMGKRMGCEKRGWGRKE